MKFIHTKILLSGSLCHLCVCVCVCDLVCCLTFVKSQSFPTTEPVFLLFDSALQYHIVGKKYIFSRQYTSNIKLELSTIFIVTLKARLLQSCNENRKYFFLNVSLMSVCLGQIILRHRENIFDFIN